MKKFIFMAVMTLLTVCANAQVKVTEPEFVGQVKLLTSDSTGVLQEQAKQKEDKQEDKPKSEISPMLRQFLDLKKKHPDALLLFRAGDFYETYKDDAEKASKILGITLTKSSKTKDDQGKPLAMAGFPYHALDTYLPKLIRAGQRVAICDQIEDPRQKVSAKSAPSTTDEPKQQQEEEQRRGFHR